MATRFNTQVGNGEYRLQFETDNVGKRLNGKNKKED